MEQAISNPHADPRGFLRALFDAAVSSALPAKNMKAHLPVPPIGRTIVVGAGKAAGSMAEAVDALWPADAPLSGIVITRYGHIPASYAGGRIEVVEAAHPVPDEEGMLATQRLLAQVDGLTENDLVLCLISGGGSSLLIHPADGISLDEKKAINSALLRSGAAINEMNCVRKHLSAIKGGRLAQRCHPAQVVTLVISDVPGDDVSMIASGPMVADHTTCEEALAVIDRYGIPISEHTRAALEQGRFETPKPGDPKLVRNTVVTIATPRLSLEAAAKVAQRFGVSSVILSDEIEGESHVVGAMHASLARAMARHDEPFQRPCVLLSGGETTVTVKGAGGRGGRATEFLLGCCITLQGAPGIWALAADTDGIDGSEDNAGAIIGPDTLSRCAGDGISPREALDQHDAYTLFEKLDDLVVTGPTLTNVNDFRAVLVL